MLQDYGQLRPMRTESEGREKSQAAKVTDEAKESNTADSLLRNSEITMREQSGEAFYEREDQKPEMRKKVSLIAKILSVFRRRAKRRACAEGKSAVAQRQCNEGKKEAPGGLDASYPGAIIRHTDCDPVNDAEHEKAAFKATEIVRCKNHDVSDRTLHSPRMLAGSNSSAAPNVFKHDVHYDRSTVSPTHILQGIGNDLSSPSAATKTYKLQDSIDRQDVAKEDKKEKAERFSLFRKKNAKTQKYNATNSSATAADVSQSLATCHDNTAARSQYKAIA
ncbi:MAG: hypothetical protein ACRDL7_14440, partial [Gaiellaceae bacterium]